MFFGIERILPNANRHAEASDARLKVRRHDPDQHSSQQENQNQDDDGLFGDDRASVSIESLTLFLENLIEDENKDDNDGENKNENIKERRNTETSDHDAFIHEQPSLPLPPPPQTNPYAAQATNAYASMADAVQTTYKSQSADITNTPLLEPSEIRTIHTLLEDLKTLKTQGIAMLDIQRSDSFLNSLVKSVQQYKSNPQP